MANISINTGEVRLTVNEDPNQVICFNPADLGFADRFYKLMQHWETAEKEYTSRAKELDPSDFPAQVSLIREISEDMKAGIDDVFGAGTSKAAFGDAITLGMFNQFFEGVTPFIEQARKHKTQKYTGGPAKGGVLR